MYSVSHTHQPYDVIEVRYSEEPQYFRSTMAMNEVSFYKVRQQQGAPNYHFVVTVQQVIGGRVSLTNSWNECATASCADTDCRNYDAERPCTEFLPDCTCKMELLPCAAGEITGSTQESFFQVTALANTSTTLVEVQLMITFIQPMVTQQPECYALGCGEVRYHDAWRAEINNDQLYRYRIKGVEGRTTMSVRDGLISLPGYPDESHAPGCRQYRVCFFSTFFFLLYFLFFFPFFDSVSLLFLE